MLSGWANSQRRSLEELVSCVYLRFGVVGYFTKEDLNFFFYSLLQDYDQWRTRRWLFSNLGFFFSSVVLGCFLLSFWPSYAFREIIGPFSIKFSYNTEGRVIRMSARPQWESGDESMAPPTAASNYWVISHTPQQNNKEGSMIFHPWWSLYPVLRTDPMVLPHGGQVLWSRATSLASFHLLFYFDTEPQSLSRGWGCSRLEVRQA